MEHKTNNRILYLDAARTLAVCLIALNHAANRTWSNYDAIQAEFVRIAKASTALKDFLTVASRFGVPLFLLITGALVLRKRFDSKEDVRHFYLHNWLGLLITSEIWFFLGFWFHIFFDPTNHMLERGLLRTFWYCAKTLLFFDQVQFESMWYIPMILSVYLLLPMFAHFLLHFPSPRVLLLPMTGLFISAMLVPAINVYLLIFWGHSLNYSITAANFFSFYILYIIAGWWIAKGGMQKVSTAVVVLGAVGGYLICCALQFFCYSCWDHLISYSSPLVFASSVCLFELLRRFGYLFEKLEKLLAAVSRSAFALYLMHVFFLEGICWYYSFGGWSRGAKVLFLEVVPLAASGIVIAFLSKMPICRKYLLLIK